MSTALVCLTVALVILACPVASAAPKKQAQPTPAKIDRNGVLILVRSALLALDHANKTGNYTVLRDLGAPAFQVNTAARLAEIFGGQRRNKLDLSGVAAIEPQLTMLPRIDGNGLMHIAGFFPSVPTQVNFNLTFMPVNGKWRVFGISVSLGQAAPAAPQARAAPRGPAAKTRKPAARANRLAPLPRAAPRYP